MKTDVLIELKALHLHGRTGAWAELVKQEGAVCVDADRILTHLGCTSLPALVSRRCQCK